MVAPLELLGQVPLVAFLDAYPEPAFVLSSNPLPHSSLDFIYGNSALHELLMGRDDGGSLDGPTFFSSLGSDDDVFWLSNPARGSHTIDVRPTWLPRDHAAVDLEVTPTRIDLSKPAPDNGPAKRSYAFIASPRRTPMNLLRSEGQEVAQRRRDARVPSFPPHPASVEQHPRSKQSKNKEDSASDSSSWPSQNTPVVTTPIPPSRLIDIFPWETTALGPRESWPTLLKLMVKYMMEKPISSAILWGWPDLVIIYNDAYAKLIGSKHPGVFGKPGRVAWGELWEVLTPALDLIQKGKATFKTDDQMFFNSLTDLHLPEELYHSWHWTPMWQEDGSVNGIWNTTWETTQKVIAERRLSGMSELFSTLADARTQQQFGEKTLEVLSKNPLDLPFIALYWCEVEGTSVSAQQTGHKGPFAVTYPRHHPSLINIKLALAGSVGIPDAHPIARPTIKYVLDPITHQVAPVAVDSIAENGVSLAHFESISWGSAPESPGKSPNNSPPVSSPKIPDLGDEMAKAILSGSIEIADPLPRHLARGLNSRGFKDIPRAAAILPICANASQGGSNDIRRNLPSAILLFGVNTRRAYDADYASWLESVGAGLSNQLTVVLQREADVKMMEERERMDKAKTMFFTNVSHELRTPLTLIQAPLEQLLAPNASNDTQYKIQLAMRNCKRLKKLIDSIMDMSKLEAGRLIGNFRPVHLARVTADLAALFRSMAEKKGINYQILCDMVDEPLVYVDTDLWEKIMCNLLSNAFKYTSKGTVTVRVAHEPTVSHVSISDTGVGIPNECINQVFDRFFRAHNSMAEGTGVGLSLTKELVSLHGGQLTVQSQTAKESQGDSGSVFTVSIPHGSGHLPAALVHNVGRPNAHGAPYKELEYWMDFEQATTTSGTNVVGDEGENAASLTLFFEKDDTLLVVDDNADMRSYLRKIFVPYLTVLDAQDGAEALQIAKSQRLNLVLCDVMMPNMDGPELLKRLREERRTKFLPVIFVTASDDGGLFGGKVEGVVDYISKPFRVRDLIARVHLQLQLGRRRLKLEEEFEVRSHELQVLTDLSPVGIFRTDAEGKLTYLNPTWHQITGFPLNGDRDAWFDYVQPRSKEDALRIWRGCFENHKSMAVRVQWKNDVWTHCAIAPLMSAEGVLLGSFGAITDINEQYLLEEARIALAEEREHIAALRAEDAEAQRQLEVERRRAQELLVDVTSHELRQPVSAIIQNAEVVRTNMKGLRDLFHDCRRRNLSYAPTDRMLNELDDDLQALDSITQCGLAQARIANDVLSLSRIQLNVLSIIPTEFDIRQETSQILLVFRNELISKEIDFKLDLGRAAGMPGLHIVSTDRSRYAQIITNLMSNAIRFTDTSTGLREIRVSLELSPSPPSDESCAPPPFPRGRSFRDRSPEPEAGETPVYIYVSVRDSGPGLQKEDLALLFQRFQQGSNAHHVFGGSGLGLFVCRQLCTLMGGRIEVVSEPGEGAIFRFFIRAVNPGHAPPLPVPGFKLERSASIQSKESGISRASVRSVSRPLPEPPNLCHKRPLHVLITEDNKINQTVLARQMKKAGFTMSLASNGLEALEAIEKSQFESESDSSSKRFDVILMDLEMPVLDGFETTREIRKRESDGSLRLRSFIIALTGNARLEQVQAARNAGVDDVIIKPYQLDSLISKMRAGPHD